MLGEGGEGERGSTSVRGASGGRRQLVVGPRAARWAAAGVGGGGDARSRSPPRASRMSGGVHGRSDRGRRCRGTPRASRTERRGAPPFRGRWRRGRSGSVRPAVGRHDGGFEKFGWRERKEGRKGRA